MIFTTFHSNILRGFFLEFASNKNERNSSLQPNSNNTNAQTFEKTIGDMIATVRHVGPLVIEKRVHVLIKTKEIVKDCMRLFSYEI